MSRQGLVPSGSRGKSLAPPVPVNTSKVFPRNAAQTGSSRVSPAGCPTGTNLRSRSRSLSSLRDTARYGPSPSLEHLISTPPPGSSPPLLTLVLDIDETLVSHSYVATTPTGSNTPSESFRPLWSSAAPTGTVKDSHFVLRPHLFSLLSYLEENSHRIEVVFWTNGSRSYASGFVTEMRTFWTQCGRGASKPTLKQLEGCGSSRSLVAGPDVNRREEQKSEPVPLLSVPFAPRAGGPVHWTCQPLTCIVPRKSANNPAGERAKNSKMVSEAMHQQKRRSSVPLHLLPTDPTLSSREKGEGKGTREEEEAPFDLFSNVIYSDDSGKGTGVKVLRRLRRANPVLLVENCAANIVSGDVGNTLIVSDFEWNAKSPASLSDVEELVTFEDVLADEGHNSSHTRQARKPPPSINDRTLSRLVEVIDSVVERLRTAREGSEGEDTPPPPPPPLRELLSDCRYVSVRNGFFSI